MHRIRKRLEGKRSQLMPCKKKNIKRVVFGKSHKKTDLTKRIGYEYYLMKLVGYDKNNCSLVDRVL